MKSLSFQGLLSRNLKKLYLQATHSFLLFILLCSLFEHKTLIDVFARNEVPQSSQISEQRNGHVFKNVCNEL